MLSGIRIKKPSHMRKYYAALYIRLSKEDEGERESESITNQRSILKTFAENENIAVFDIYADDGWSGTGFDRPAFNRMIEAIESGKVNTVIVKDMSRLGRDYIMTGYYMERYFPEKQVRFISVLDGIDTETESNANDITPFRAIMNDMYSKDISKKIRSVKHDKQKKGLFIGGKAPYGYVISRENKNGLEIDEKAAETVRFIFNSVCDGHTPTETAELLNLSKLPPPAVYAGLKNEGIWKSAAVLSIIKNEMYIGNMVQGKRKRAGYKTKKCVSIPKEHWSIIENTHEPIVSREIFEKANARLKSRGKIRRGENNYFLKGLVFCGECGKSMSVTKRNNSKGENIHYIISKTKGCIGHCMRYDSMESEILGAVAKEKASLSRSELKKIAEEIVVERQIKNKNRKKELEAVEKTIDRLYSDRIAGKIEESDYLRLYSLQRQKRDAFKLREDTDNDAEEIADSFLSEEVGEKTVLISLIERVEVGKNGEISIFLSYINKSEE